MSAAVAPEVTDRATDDDPGVDHYFCCDENRGLCGTDLTEVAFNPDMGDDDLCVVCDDLDQFYGCDDPSCPERNP